MVIAELVSLLGFKVDSAGAQQFDAMMGRLQANASNAASNIESVFKTSALAITGAFAGLAMIGKPIAEAGDAMNTSIAKIESSIGRSATSAAEAEDIYSKLYDAGKLTGVSADESSGAFTRFNLAMQELNRPASDTIKLIEGIQAAGIVAGTTTAELTGSMLQLGQALASGKLQGDELKSLRESMPSLLRDIVKELGITQKEFFEQAEKGLLTPERIVPALLKASEKARSELASFPLSMSRAFSVLTNSATRFLAELDKQLKLSSTLARAFQWIATTLDSWRSGLSVVGELVSFLGGLEGIARIVGIALLLAFGTQIFGAITGLVSLFATLGRMILTSLLPLAGFVAWIILIEDFIGWIQGKDSLFGRAFGNFDDVIAPVKTQIESFKAWLVENFNFGDAWENTKREFETVKNFFTETFAYISEAWNRNVEGMKPQFEWLSGIPKFLSDAFSPLAPFFNQVFSNILAGFNVWYDRIVYVFNGIKSAISSVLSLLPSMPSADGAGGGAGSDPAGQEERRRRFGARAGGFYGPDAGDALDGFLAGRVPDVTGRTGGGAGGTVNAPQSNTITNEITINAPSADPAGVAAGVNSGMGRATDTMTTRLGNSFALGLGISSPRVEAPASP